MHVYKKIDAWEQCKLGDLGSVVMNRRIFKEETADKGDIPFYKIGTFGGEADSYITREKFEDYKLKYPYPETGDILISASGSIGRTVEYNGEEAYYQDSNIVWLKHDKQLYNLFLKQFYFIVKWSGVEGTTIKRLYNKNILDTEINIPSINEQKEIGGFFKQLDNTIALHQRKLDALKMMKKALLQQMFPENGEKTPRLRFADFEEEWEQRKLGEIVERVIRKNKNLKSTLPLTISAKEGLIDQNEFFNKTIASRDVSGYYLVKNGEFAYNKSYSNGYPWGAIKRLNHYDMGVLSTLYIVFKPTNINSDFLEKYYDTTYWHKEISKHATEGARNHGLLNIAATVFFESKLTVPKDCDEQEKVGMLFCHLDETIILYQKKLNQFYKLKKAYLQKMFI